ncbi:hypothetical protein J4E91_004301 [Alternaria rosae]|nr:hypothetical protein J4E91_004301 [Alternaria rosae]
MDVEKCIELHNRIVAHACSRLPPDRQPQIQRSWFTAHSIDPSSPVLVPEFTEIELDDELKAFLTGPGYDPGGLVYSHSTQQVCYMDTPHLDSDNLDWDDLQTALETYWDCVESEKFVIDVEFSGFDRGDGLTTQGWRLQE